MSSTASPYGAKPVGALSANGSFNGRVREYSIATTYNTNIFAGDFVKAATAGVIQLDAGTATLTPIGIFMGCNYTDPTSGQFITSNYWPANNAATDAVGFVLDDPDVEFMMQGDATLAQTALFANAAVIQTAGSTALGGPSKNALNAGSIDATNTLPIRIIEFAKGSNMAVGDDFTDVICKFNVGHFHRTTTGLA